MKIIAAMLYSWRRDFLDAPLKAVISEPLIDHLYINYQDRYGIYMDDYNSIIPSDIFTCLDRFEYRKYSFDHWKYKESASPIPSFDQDTARLTPIVTARNMALEYVTNTDATHILFVDSDVTIHPGGLQKLIDLDVPLCGGYVPGRGAHSHAHYLFGEISREGEVVKCKHGTMGYCLIQRSLFEVLRCRTGGHPSLEYRHVRLSEDPAFAADAERYWNVNWYIHLGATADHLDDPVKPLAEEEAVNDYEVV